MPEPAFEEQVHSFVESKRSAVSMQDSNPRFSSNTVMDSNAILPSVSQENSTGGVQQPEVSETQSNSIQQEAAQQPGRFKIYTKTGDKGTSSLYSGERRRKDDAVFEALGDVDELNSALGVAHEYCSLAKIGVLCTQIEEIQSRLLDVGTAVATPLDKSSSRKVQRARFDASAVASLEKWIDEFDERLPPLRNFILPSGGLASSHLHVARTLCRRAERRVVPLVDEQHVEGVVAQYLNRLSDYLFTAARHAAAAAARPETVYKKAA